MNSDHHTKTILAVDEESIVRSVLNATLSRAGYRVLDATSCKEAVRLSMGFPESIELLVTDVELKDGTGEELASQVLAIRPDVHVLYMSAWGPLMGEPEGNQASAIVLEKPFRAKKLVSAVQHEIGPA
jgi:DNA-binding NtrC family response regulator